MTFCPKQDTIEAPSKDTIQTDFASNLEALLEKSLDKLGDKVSDRILKMLERLQGTEGPAREEQLRAIKQAADEELVDLSNLFMHQEGIKSNLEDIGVDEKEAKGIDKNLERLRELRAKNES